MSGGPSSGLENQHGSRRRHGHGIDGRDDHRRGDRHGELLEEAPRDAGNEGARNEHGTEHQSDREDRPGDLCHRLDGRLPSIEARGHLPFDVLQNHNRVVYYDPDGEHQAEERDVVQAVSQESHDGKGADRAATGTSIIGSGIIARQSCKNTRITSPTSRDCLEERPVHVGDRLADERRGIVADLVLHPGRKPGFQLFEPPPHRLGDVERVAAGELEDVDSDGRVEVIRGILTEVGGPEFYVGNFAETGRCSQRAPCAPSNDNALVVSMLAAPRCRFCPAAASSASGKLLSADAGCWTCRSPSDLREANPGRPAGAGGLRRS